MSFKRLVKRRKMPQTAPQTLDRLQNGDSLNILNNHNFATDNAFERRFTTIFSV
jgi:hypothetical protein